MKLLVQDEEEAEGKIKASDRLWNAIRTIAIADAVMSEALNMVARRRAAHATIRMANLDLKRMRGPNSPKPMRACGEHASASQEAERMHVSRKQPCVPRERLSGWPSLTPAPRPCEPRGA